jgi:glycosyltransferase involved in cell wall biosynthesis
MISVVIPTLNEEVGIRKTITSIPKVRISELGYNLEILVIDGNSIDLTREVARELGAKVIVEKRKGYGRAYKTGLAMATGDIIVTLDADGTYPAELIPEYIQILNEKYLDFITINRFSQIEDGAMSLLHIIGNKILSSAVQLLYSVNIKDSQSGMWIMKKSFVDRIILNSDDMSMSEEIKIIAFKSFKSLELEGKYSNRIGTAKLNTIGHGWTNLKYLFKYRDLLKFAIMPSRMLEKELAILKESQ